TYAARHRQTDSVPTRRSSDLFESGDDGETWAVNEPLLKERESSTWNPGAGGLALHSICPWPGDPLKLAIGVSAVGVWLTEDGGRSEEHTSELQSPDHLVWRLL